jgi:predicted permease
MFQRLLQDARFGLRMLAKNRGFTAVAVLTLALGIGANTAIFSLLDQILLSRLPVKDSGELVIVKTPGPRTGHVWSDGDYAESNSYPMYKGLRDNNSVFSGMLARYAFSASIASAGQTEYGHAELVSGNYFDVLGVRPAVGRLFTEDDDRVQGQQPVAVLSYAYWQRRFGGDPSVLNKTLLVNNTPLTIVGVSRAGFRGVQIGQSPDVFVPAMMKGRMTPERNGLDDWNDYWASIIARRKPGVSMEAATAGINVAYAALLREQLATIKSWDEKKRSQFLEKKVVLAPGMQGRTTLQRDSGSALIVLTVMVGLVLLITCANIASLQLARGASRQREMAIRAALGASRGQMIRQLLVESLICGLAGGAAGIFVGAWSSDLLIRTVTTNLNIHGLSPEMNRGVVLFALGLTLACVAIFGLVPAWRVTRTRVSETLKNQGTNASASSSHVRMRKVLVAAQIAFTMLLLAGACLYTRTLWNLRNENLGIRTDNVVTFSISPGLNGYSRERATALIDRLQARVAGTSGVSSAAAAEIPVLSGDARSSNVTVEGNPQIPEDLQDVNYLGVSSGYFSTLGIPLVSGREFTATDNASSPKVAVVSESFVKRFFPKRSPLGAHFVFGGGSKVVPNIEIVGVAKDVKQEHVKSENQPYAYLPFSQAANVVDMTFYVRTHSDPLALTNTLRSEVQEADSNLPVYNVKTMERVVDEDLFGERMVAGLTGAFGALAALLAGLGVYGVLAFLVLQRTREIGIRMALGAQAQNVRWLLFRELGFMLIAGIAVGLPLAFGLAKLSESLLYGVRPQSFSIYLADLFFVGLIAAAAWYLPARRATKVVPMVALRYE